MSRIYVRLSCHNRLIGLRKMLRIDNIHIPKSVVYFNWSYSWVRQPVEISYFIYSILKKKDTKYC